MSEELQAFGLSQYESKTYFCLLKHHLISANEISKLAGIPQGRIYTILSQLEQKGLCTIYPGNVKRYAAVSPKIALRDQIEKEKERVKAMEALSEKLEEEYEQRESNGNPIDYVQILTSKQSQVEKFDELIKGSKQCLYSFNKSPYATGFKRNLEEIDKASAPLKKIIKEGTSVRAIFEEETEDKELFHTMIDYYHSIGEEVRVARSLPIKMLLSDNQLMMLSLRNVHTEKFNLTTMVVEHSDLTAALLDLFNYHWDQAIPYEEYKKS